MRECGGDIAPSGARQAQRSDEPGHSEQRAQARDDGPGWLGHDDCAGFTDSIGGTQPHRRADPAADHGPSVYMLEPPAVIASRAELCAAASWSRVATSTVLPSLCRPTSRPMIWSAAA